MRKGVLLEASKFIFLKLDLSIDVNVELLTLKFVLYDCMGEKKFNQPDIS